MAKGCAAQISHLERQFPGYEGLLMGEYAYKEFEIPDGSDAHFKVGFIAIDEA